MRTHCNDCDRPDLCDISNRGTAPCGQNAGLGPAASKIVNNQQSAEGPTTASEPVAGATFNDTADYGYLPTPASEPTPRIRDCGNRGPHGHRCMLDEGHDGNSHVAFYHETGEVDEFWPIAERPTPASEPQPMPGPRREVEYCSCGGTTVTEYDENGRMSWGGNCLHRDGVEYHKIPAPQAPPASEPQPSPGVMKACGCYPNQVCFMCEEIPDLPRIWKATDPQAVPSLSGDDTDPRIAAIESECAAWVKRWPRAVHKRTEASVLITDRIPELFTALRTERRLRLEDQTERCREQDAADAEITGLRATLEQTQINERLRSIKLTDELKSLRATLDARDAMLDRMVRQTQENATELERHATAATGAINLSLQLLRELEASRAAASLSEEPNP